ncbi:acyl-CoA N-acyltransferase [Aspergillus karnatakaensis]|uniref:GNAT family N-acetyltransferase n=1 Tax=Aspergillus karnatakaensis TaxID=1810916 RepID=UPI003CCD94EE
MSPPTQAAPTTFKILPIEETDIYEALVASEAAFKFHYTLMYTSPLSPASLEKKAASRASTFPTEASQDIYNFKAVDDATGKIVASSRWSIHHSAEFDPRTIAECVEAKIKLDLPELNRDVARALYREINIARRETLAVPPDNGEALEIENGCMVRKHIELEGLSVHPEYQRRGIAKALLQWGLEEADRLGLDVYLEATEDGKPFYALFGFETVRIVAFEDREFATMIRPAKKPTENEASH